LGDRGFFEGDADRQADGRRSAIVLLVNRFKTGEFGLQ